MEKDDTDTFLSFRSGFERGYKNFVIFGGTGGRIDHTIANIQTLSHIAKCGGRGFLIGNGSIITAIYNSKICFPTDCIGTVSVFAQDTAKKVTITGMKYNVQNAEFSPHIPLGVSNEFTLKQGTVSVEDGVLLIVWYEKTSDFFKHFDLLLI